MKKLITFIIIILSVIPIYGKKINYKSSCVYYYLPLDECLDSRGFLNFEYATLKGPNFWALIFLDNGDVLFENNTWGSLNYGMVSNYQTVNYTRQQAINYLNRWLNFYNDIAKDDRKYRYDGYSTSYYYYGVETEFEACSDLNIDPDILKNGDKVDLYYTFGYSTDNIKKNIFITKDRKTILLCPSDQKPCLDEVEGKANYTIFIRFDINYYLPK